MSNSQIKSIPIELTDETINSLKHILIKWAANHIDSASMSILCELDDTNCSYEQLVETVGVAIINSIIVKSIQVLIDADVS